MTTVSSLRYKFNALIRAYDLGAVPMSTSTVILNKELATRIMSLLEAHKNNPNLLVPLVVTTHGEKALDTLIYMLSCLPEDSLVLNYILDEFSGAIEVTASINGDQLESNVKIDMTNVNAAPAIFKHKYPEAGVYFFSNKGTNDQYVGSAITFGARVSLHLQQLAGLATPAYFHKWVNQNSVTTNLVWSPVYYTRNYLRGFIMEHPTYRLSVGEFHILQAMSQFLPRVLEANLLDHLNTTLNRGSGDQVYFNYVDFNPADLNDHDTPVYGASSKSVEIRDAMSGELIRVAPSIVSCAAYLGLSRTSLKQVLGSLRGVKSKSLDMLVTVNKVGQSLLEVDIVRRLPHNWSPLVLVNTTLDQLVGSDIYIYAEDLTTVYATYPSWSKAFYGLYPSKSDVPASTAKNRSKPLMRACNNHKAVVTEKGTFYVARNPNFHSMKDQ